MSARDHQILDAVPLMIFATDRDGIVVQQNLPATLVVGNRSGSPLHVALGDESEAEHLIKI